MTGVAPVDETAATPTEIPAEAHEVTGEGAEAVGYVPTEASVSVGYLHGSRVSHSWHISVMNTLAYDKSMGLNLIGSIPFAVSCSGPNSLPEGRNLVVQHFLDTDAEWLFFVDTDMGFEADALERLVLAADPVKRPVVGGLCFAMKHMGSDGRGGFNVMPVPTLFMLARNPKQGLGFANRFIYPEDSMVQVAGTGAAFLLVHRSVLERVRAKYGDAWFNLVQYDDGSTVSEDLSFCWRVTQLGVPIFVNTAVKTTHHKEMWLGEQDYTQPPREPMARMMEAATDEEGEYGGLDPR